MKRCYACATEKEDRDFYPNKAKKDGLSTECKTCSRSKASKYHHTNTSKVRNSNRLRRYGVDEKTYLSMLVQQDNKCCICKQSAADSPKGILFVDHCHSSGKVRGLLCHHCNLVIGHAKDSIDTLEQSIVYLRKHNEEI